MKYVEYAQFHLVSTLTDDEKKIIRDSLTEEVSHPGKFQGENIYVPWFWIVGLNGGSDASDDECFDFMIEPEERGLFPELEGVEKIRLWESEDGFVTCQIRDGLDDSEEE